MASDDDFYIVVVDDSVGDTGTQVIEIEDGSKNNDDIVNDIFKHFNCDIKKEELEVTSIPQENIKEELIPEDFEYDSTVSEQYEKPLPHEIELAEDFLEDEPNLSELDEYKHESEMLASIEKYMEYLIKKTRVNLDEIAKTKVIEFIKAMLAHAGASPPPLNFTPYNTLDDEYECQVCFHMSKTVKASLRHYRYKHGIKHHQCLACFSTYRRHDTLLFHEQYCNKEDSHLLRIARQIFNDKRDEEKLSKKTKSKYVKVACRVCSKLISRSNMKVHIEAHMQIRKYECKLCSASFRANRALKSHMNYHYGKKPYQCDQCPKAYPSYNGLLVHKQRHKSIFYECDICNAVYVKKSSLSNHRKKHLEAEDDSEILCTICGEVVSSETKMIIHLKRHKTKSRKLNKNMKYQCNECPKICSSLTNVKYHMKKCHDAEIYSRKKFFNILPEMNIMAKVEGEIPMENEVIVEDDIVGI